MRRWRLKRSTMVWLIASGALAALWIIAAIGSGLGSEHRKVNWSVHSDGTLSFATSDGWPCRIDSWTRITDSRRVGMKRFLGLAAEDYEWAYIYDPTGVRSGASDDQGRPLPAPPDHQHPPSEGAARGRYWYVPILWPLTVVASLPAYRLVLVLVDRRCQARRQACESLRRSHGQCARCGYDMRASQHCFPECGHREPAEQII
jgi:hypothetical protein